MKPDGIRKYTTKQLLEAVAATVLCGLIVVWACIIKYYVIGDPVTAGIWFCMLTLVISVAVFMGGVLLFAMVSRTYIIAHPRYYIAFLSVVTLTFVAHLYLSILSPLLIAPGMTAMMIVQLSRQKQDAFIFNMVEALMIFWALVVESVMTDGEVFMGIGGGSGLYLWLLSSITVINIGAGAVIPLVIRDKTKRLNYLMAGVCIMLGSVAIFVLMALVHSERDHVLGNFWLLFISGAVPLVVSQIVNPIVESAFNLITDSRLSELTDSRRPLLRRLATEAAGTYNHSLAVANLAET